MCSAACAMACKPDEQNRLIVIAEDELGNLTSHIHPLLRFGRGAADDHVFDLFRLDLGRAGHQFLDHPGGHVIGPRVFQRAARRFAHRGAQRIDDYCFTHCLSPSFTGTVPRVSKRLTDEIAACLRARYCTDLTCFDFTPALFLNSVDIR
jgi:hypothetical protein